MKETLLKTGIFTIERGGSLTCMRTHNLNGDDYETVYFFIYEDKNKVFESTPNRIEGFDDRETTINEILMDINDGFLFKI